MVWAVGGMQNVSKHEEKKPFLRLGLRWQNDIRMNFRWMGVD
jgi:hypothetical protein